MILIIGGAYQGKLDYAMSSYPGKTVFQCGNALQIDTTADIINSLHLLILSQIRAGADPLAYIREILPELSGKIVICDDISCGVVPTDGEARAWREAVGRCLAVLSGSESQVIRVFCGIGCAIK